MMRIRNRKNKLINNLAINTFTFLYSLSSKFHMFEFTTGLHKGKTIGMLIWGS